jgi:hypothetical protein
MWLLLILVAAHASPYHEELHLIPYTRSTLLAGFHFTFLWDSPSPALVTNFEYFPPFLPAAMDQAGSNYWEVTLTQGQGAQFAGEMLEAYNSLAHTAFTLRESGLTARADYTTNWSLLSPHLGALVCGHLSTFTPTLLLHNEWHIHGHDFNCKENLVNVIKLLPCRDGKGLGQLLKDALYGSGYNHVMHRGIRELNRWRYDVEVLAEVPSTMSFRVKKEAVCLSSVVYLPEGQAVNRTTADKVSLDTLAAPQPSGKCVSLISERRLGGDIHSFEAWYQHQVENCLDEPVDVTITELFPPQMIPLFSSLILSAGSWTVNKGEAGWELTVCSRLQPGERIRLKVRLVKVMQVFESYPTDPQRGWDVPSMPLFYSYKGERLEQPTSRLLIMIPEPDFSMPFNVMCVACSLISFYFTTLQTFTLWKRPTHWSSPRYEDEVIKAERVKKYARHTFLAITVVTIYLLDKYGIVRVFG